MKTKPLFLLALGSALFSAGLRANDIEPTKEKYTAIHRGTAPIVVDGDLTEWAGVPVLADPKFAVPKGSGPGATKAGDCTQCVNDVASPNYVLFEELGGTWSGPDDQTSAVEVAWDDQNIYFAFAVTDDFHENTANSAWNGDSVQLMIADSSRSTQVALYNYALGGTDDAPGAVIVEHEAGPAANADCACETSAVVKRDTAKKKTYYEIKLPKASLGLTTLAAGTQFGLGMAINDGDEPESQHGQKGWGGLGAHSIVYGKHPSETALVTLSSEVPGQDRLFFSAINPSVAGLTFRATDKGASVVDPATAKLTIDNQVVTLTSSKSGDATDFSYAGTTPFAPGTKHTYVIEVKDKSGNLVNSTGEFTTAPYTLLSAGDKVTVDTSKPGFLWNVHQVDSASTLPTTNDRTINQLAGLLGANVADPNATGPASGPGTPASPGNAPIKFIVPGVINFSQTEGDANGNATPDLAMPGIPGTTTSTDNIAAEILTAVEFPSAGLYHLIVNSDDAFRTTLGKGILDAFTPAAGEFNAGRGAADTQFDVYVDSPGIYPMRTIYNEGGGGANIELLSVAGSGKALLNDTSNPQALKTYQLDASKFPAYVRSLSPSVGGKTLTAPKTIEASIVDLGTTVSGTPVLKINGTAVTVTSSKNNGVTKVTYTPSSELTPNTEYSAELVFTDTNGPRTNTWKFTTGPLSSTLFVIEAEDFDYDGGKTNPQKGTAGMDVDVMPYFGGAYDTLGAIEGIDYNNDDGNDSDQYRTETDANGENEVNITASNGQAPGNGSGGTLAIGSNDRVTYTATSNYRIGWVGGGNWNNYTRNFPNNGKGGWWKVYAALSYGDVGAGQLSGTLERVTSGVGTDTQTTELLGSFSAPGSGAWGADNLVPMKNASGGEAVVKLSGLNTVRFNEPSGDFDFLIFSAAAPPPPYINVAPRDSVLPDAVVLDWELKDTDAKVAEKSVKVFVDDQDVTSKSTVSRTNDTTYVHLDMGTTKVASGLRNWKLTFDDNSTPAINTPVTGTFTVVPFDIPNIFVIEAEDFNYSDDDVNGGKTNPQKGTAGLDVDVMPYDGGAYSALSAVKGVDYNNADGNDSDVYRTEKDENGENEVNITASNGNRYSNTRGSFDLVSNYRIGWVAAGEWQNYTRTFPSNSYNVWAALSYDGVTAGLLNGTLDLVTSDPTKPNQVTQRLGTFEAPGSGGWGRNELVPMKDTSGSVAKIDLGGVETVRFNLGSGDFDYLLFVPAGSTQVPEQPRFTSIRRNANGSITVEWTGAGTLQYTPSLSPATWTPLAGQTSPYTFTPAANQPMLFARIVK
jgi:hypothetical protein